LLRVRIDFLPIILKADWSCPCQGRSVRHAGDGQKGTDTSPPINAKGIHP
jgi:hypothetical protein